MDWALTGWSLHTFTPVRSKVSPYSAPSSAFARVTLVQPTDGRQTVYVIPSGGFSLLYSQPFGNGMNRPSNVYLGVVINQGSSAQRRCYAQNKYVTAHAHAHAHTHAHA